MTRHIRDHCLCLHAQRAARMLARRFDEALRPLDLTNGQFSLLTSLNRPEPARMGSVAALLGMDRTTLTAALKPLERRGLVEVAVDAEDRRSRVLTLTRAGRALLAKAFPIWKKTHSTLEGLLVASEPDLLRRDLRALSG
jgi:DNA-binding MarR family transcriptional regulator